MIFPKKEGNTIIRPHITALGPGVTLYRIPCDKFKTNCLSLRILCPLDPATAAATALLPFVLKRGTARLPSQLLLAREAENLYNTVLHPFCGKLGHAQYIGFSALPLRASYTEGKDMSLAALSLMAELLYHPYLEQGQLSKSYVESEKRVMIEQVEAKINDKDSFAVLRCREELGQGDVASYPETGTVEEIEALTAGILTDRLHTVLATCQIDIFCVGDFEEDLLIAHCRSLFVKGARPTPSPISHRTLLPTRREPRETVEELPTKQGKLCLGFLAEDGLSNEDAPCLSLFLEVLANAPTAKLFLHVRERLSLCYYCSAIAERTAGALILASGIDVASRERAEKAILAEMEACQRGEISKEELDAAKRSLLTVLQTLYDDPGALLNWFFRGSLVGRTATPDEQAASIASLSRDDLARLARRMKLQTVYFMKGTADGEEDTDD